MEIIPLTGITLLKTLSEGINQQLTTHQIPECLAVNQRMSKLNFLKNAYTL